MTVFPEGREAPSPFRQNILPQFHGGAGVVGADVACSARHSCLPPTSSAATARELRQAASACYSRKPLPNPSFLALLLTPPYLSVISRQEPARDLLEKRGEPRVSSHSPSCAKPPATTESPFVCVYRSAFFHRSRCGSSRDQPHRFRVTVRY